ncbi:MAG TPA: pyridoxal phosphate-dependent aminotransferase family protein [Candidatus Paceibacterota bacterium]|nr:pyridoxal phosphate-dependent aminotransferase family protein [Verrucomicrobiota bacterium]HSA11793.1 pyridoxal phosphate-dependent aminotransferase family protein [Candidatus Paceibacterota bacterium]
MTEPEPLQQVDRTCIRYRRRKLAYFSGCDYFRLASHPRVAAALRQGLKKYGLNVAASRMTTGNHILYGELERELAAFFAAESALVVPSGYATNLVVAQTLAGSFSHALIDSTAHTSLSDAARLLDCPVLQFKSRDAEALAGTARRCGPGARLIVLTDGMFSGDGSAAPLAEYLKVLPKDALLLVDDAHGAGVLGRTGKGALEHAGVSRRRIIQTVTLSKAFGAYGGAILCTAAFRRNILDRSHMFIGSTPLPLPLAAAALAGVRILKADPGPRRRLADNAAYVKTALRNAGLPLAEAPGPIIRLLPRRRSDAIRLRRALLAAGIFPPFIKYPGGPPGGCFRFVISSEHSRPQLDALLKVLRLRQF